MTLCSQTLQADDKLVQSNDINLQSRSKGEETSFSCVADIITECSDTEPVMYSVLESDFLSLGNIHISNLCKSVSLTF
jgi:hypothetical protein